MADFPFLSDSDDDRKVEELLSQAMDDSVLQQVAAINCSGFTDSVLPTHLETRFNKLKSFPATKPKSHSHMKNSASTSTFNSQIPPIEPLKPQLKKTEPQKSQSDHDNVIDDSLPTSKPKSESGLSDSPSKLSDSSRESAIFSPSKPEKSRTKSSASNSRSSSMESPPRKTGCFWCSPKRVSSKKSNKENEIGKIDLGWGKEEEFLSELTDFSTKGQQKLLKKVMKEEERINSEAEKIVKWAKQASARIEVSGLEDELSDDDEHMK